MVKDYLLKLKDQLFNKEEQEYLEYINKRDLVIHDLTRDWSSEEIDSFNEEHSMFLAKRNEPQIKRYILDMNRHKYFNDDDYDYFKKLFDGQEKDIKKLTK